MPFPACSSWQLLHQPPPGVAISDVDMFADACVLYQRRDGRPAVSVLRLSVPGDSQQFVTS